jgi:hypothetical protein
MKKRDRARRVERLSAGRGELEQAIGNGARERVADPDAEWDAVLTAALTEAIPEILEYSLETIEAGGPPSAPVPWVVVEQARCAARSGVGLETVLRCFTAGYEVLDGFVVEEVARAELTDEQRIELRKSVSESLASLLGLLLGTITEEYVKALESKTGA